MTLIISKESEKELLTLKRCQLVTRSKGGKIQGLVEKNRFLHNLNFILEVHILVVFKRCVGEKMST
jgi:hypothetical protein